MSQSASSRRPTQAGSTRSAQARSTRAKRDRPLLIVNTGDGKGKTTAAIGIAMRTWAAGGSVGIFQFVKAGKWRTGEWKVFDLLNQQRPGSIEWQILGQGFSWIRSTFSEEQKAQCALEGWRYIAEGIAAQRHDLWLLDEFTYPMLWGWVSVDEVVETLRSRPGKQHVVITGRRCPAEVVELADLVTEMTKIKHPFDQGQRGQLGIEW